MYVDTLAWREGFSVPRCMASFGQSGTHATERGRGGCADLGAAGQPGGPAFGWQRGPEVGSLSALATEVMFFGKLAGVHPTDGGPVAVWRLGMVDFAGITREVNKAAAVPEFCPRT